MKVRNIMMAVAALAAGSLSAATGFSYQGRIVDADGAPLLGSNGIYKATLSIWDERSGGKELFSQEISVSPSSNGTFNAEIADNGRGELSKALSVSADRYVELRLGDGQKQEAVSPRQKILAAPSAIYAQNVSEAKGDFEVKGNTVIHGNLTVCKNDGGSSGGNSSNDAVMKLTDGNLHTGPITVNETLDVAGNGTFQKDLTVQGKLTVNGNVEISSTKGDLTVSAPNTAFTVKSLDVASGAITVNGINLGVPYGVIAIWSGSSTDIPDGWALCNGSNGTPDLTGRFVVGAGNSYGQSNRANDGGQPYSAGATGGSRTVTLTTEQLPSHHHEYYGDDQLDVAATKIRTVNGYDASSKKSSEWPSGWFKTSEVGGNQAHDNLPPYYALCYIMKVK